MPAHPSPPLIAILLIAKSTSGPKLVFHYPASPSTTSALLSGSARQTSWGGAASNSTDTADGASSDNSFGDDESDDAFRSDDEGEETGSKSGRASTRGGASGRESAMSRGRGIWGRGEVEEAHDEEEEDDVRSAFRFGTAAKGRKKQSRKKSGKEDSAWEWEKVLGYRAEALEMLLSPSRAFHKKKFEMSIEGTVFLGCPMFVREDGAWRKKRRRETRKSTAESEKPREDSMLEAESRRESVLSQQKVGSPDPVVYPPGWEPGYGHGLMSGAASDAGSDAKSASTNETDSEMTMFHVVFLMNPPSIEYRIRVKEMYDNVVRKFSKALKYEQARYNYVWNESKKILSLKSKAKENNIPSASLWPTIIHSSTLAKAIAIIYEAISNNKIAHIHLDNNFDTSFKIPQPDWTPYISTPSEPQKPGLWLTTTNLFAKDDAETSAARHCALLLLEDKESLIKEIEGDSKAGSAPLAFYIRALTPTKSLQKLSIAHSIPSRDIEFIAGHLVYWRRARLIPPLHPRDTYIVSPNCDMRALPLAIPAYAARFPSLPSLPKMLSMLSGVPRPYGSYIPSTDHKSVYMDILAWLMRGGWVTQLRTFAWVCVSAEIKAEAAAMTVKEIRQEDESASSANETADDSAATRNGRNSSLSEQHSTPPKKRSPNRETGDSAESSPAGRPQSPRKGTYLSPTRPGSDSGSNSSGRSLVSGGNRNSSPRGQKSLQLKRPSPLHINQSASSSGNNGSSTTDISSQASLTSPRSPSPGAVSSSQLLSPPPVPTVASFTPSLVLNPQKANSQEASWLECIRQKFQDEDLKEMWPVLVRYFDGRHAVDDIALREGLKRKRVAGLIGQIKEAGVLITVKHW